MTSRQEASFPNYDKAPARFLLAEAQFRDDCAVALDVCLVQIGKLSSPLADHLEQPSSAVVVLAVGAEVLREVVDPLGQKSDLHFGRTSVAFVCLVCPNDL
jgi:hypothetical protein